MIARETLKRHGIDPDHVKEKDLTGKHKRELYRIAVMAGAARTAEDESAASLVKKAQKDPVLRAPLAEKERAACAKRAQMLGYLLFGSDDGLSKDDKRLIQELVEVHGTLEKTIKVLLEVSTTLSPAELVNDVSRPITKAESLWVKEYISQLGLVTTAERDELTVRAAVFFQDQHPLTSWRLAVLKQARREGCSSLSEMQGTATSAKPQ